MCILLDGIRFFNSSKQFHLKERNIWLTRHGESLFNAENRIGGDPELTESGVAYSIALAEFFKGQTHFIFEKNNIEQGGSLKKMGCTRSTTLSDGQGIVQTENAPYNDKLLVWTSQLYVFNFIQY